MAQGRAIAPKDPRARQTLARHRQGIQGDVAIEHG
jgi:hypothetical protein